MNDNGQMIILGGGLAGLSLAYFFDGQTIILEKEKQLGGLCRSFDFKGVKHDIGPHIFFSKNPEILELLLTLTDTDKIRRSNRIYHKGKLIKYPFENDLAALPSEDKEYCLQEFLNNPYENYDAKNMLQFFLKTFGEGITRLYLQPLNEKIWKFDPAYMDTQMVERIPKPPREDVIKSAEGTATEGYLHQLFFHYPKSGGIQQLVDGLTDRISNKSRLVNSVKIEKISRKDQLWQITTNQGIFTTDTLINCMPLTELFKSLDGPPEVIESINGLKYNSIYIVMINAKKDNIGNNFAFNFADKSIIFHRISNLRFLGESYCPQDGSAMIMAEITYRPGSYLASLNEEAIKEKVLADLDALNLIESDDVIDVDLKSFQYAYIIYDFDHRKNVDHVLGYLSELGIQCCGRFAEFEYLNMDKVVEHSYSLARKLKTG